MVICATSFTSSSSNSAVTVTVCGVFHAPGANSSEAGDTVTFSVVLLANATFTAALGWVFSCSV